jgi:uncharacterized protein YwgA
MFLEGVTLMSESYQALEAYQVAARIVNEAGGRLVGRTRLQKVACLAMLAGFLPEFDFEYRHYGPYSETLAGSMETAADLSLLTEREERTEWGGWYSVYSQTDQTPVGHDVERRNFIAEAAKIGPISLELAATAAFLNTYEGFSASEAWEETAHRKPEKADGGRLERAKIAYAALLNLPSPTPLPRIV